MADIARIGFVADTSDLKTAKDDLNALVPAANNAGRAADTFSNRVGKMGDTLSGKVTNSLTTLKAGLIGFAAGLATAFIGQLSGALGETADRLDDISKAASKLKVNAGDLQGLAYAGDLAGVSFDQLATVANKMNRVIGQAIAKGKETDGVFKLLGISAKELAALPIDERFGAIADKMNAMNLTADQTALILGQLGDRSGALAALFEGGSAAISQAADQLERFGGTITNEQGKDVEAMNDAFTSLQYAISAATNQFVVFLSQTGITTLINGIAELVGWFNRSTAAATAFRAVFSALATAFNPVYTAVKGLAAIFQTVFGVNLTTAAKAGVNFVINAVTGMYGYIKTILSGVPQLFSAAFYGGAAMALKAINNFVQQAIGMFNGLAKAIGAAFNVEIGNLADPAAFDMSNNPMVKAINARSDAAVAAAKGVFEDANNAFSSQMAVDNFAQIGDVASKTTDQIKPATSAMTDFGGALDKAGSAAGGAAEKLTELQKIGKELDALSAPFDQAKTAFDKLEELKKNGIVSGDQYTAMLKRIQDAFIATGGTAEQWGKIIANKTSDMTTALKDFTTSGLTSVGDTLADLAVDGKADFKALADGIMKDLIRMMWQALIVKPIIGSLFGFESGGVFSGGVKAFANGGAFTNKVYNRPTPFKFANGSGFASGVMGEAGPEAVMPLKRGPNGSLGVEAHGMNGGRGGGNVLQIGDVHISVESSGNAEDDARMAEMTAEAFKERVREIANEQISAANAYGGTYNPRGVR
jgi:hypothetical protein